MCFGRIQKKWGGIGMETVSDILFYLGLIVGGYGFLQIYISKRGLPEGACPIESNIEFIALAILLFMVSLTLSFISDYRKRKV